MSRMKYCLVPNCLNSSITTPKKLFFHIPKTKDIRRAWFHAIGLENKFFKTSLNSVFFCCEDHFNLEEDMVNYHHYKLMPHAHNKHKIKTWIVPHIIKHKGIVYNIIHPSNQEEAFTNTTEDLSQSSEGAETSTSTTEDLENIKVENTDIFAEPLPVINIKQEENTDSLTNINPIISHRGCSIFKNNSQTTNNVISFNELLTINTEVHIKTEIPTEQDETFHNNTTDFYEEPMVPVTQNESLKPIQTNNYISILKKNLINTLNTETFVKNSSEPDEIITTRGNNIMPNKECTTADESKSENENFTIVVLRTTLAMEKAKHRRKVLGLQGIIRRLRNENEKLKDTIKELKLENSLYS